MTSAVDAVVVGSGPNGLTAAAFLAKAGLSVRVVEAATSFGGGLRTEELTLPGYRHDLCSAVHTMGCLSPAFAQLGLEQRGLTWLYPPISAAHPLDDGRAACLRQSIEATAVSLGADERAYRDL